jgi:MarR family transcriptional regulator, lower aerobic nicotinate degradation pathway regulator
MSHSTKAQENTITEPKRYHLEEQVGFLLRQVSQRHTTIFGNHMGENITPTQWAALVKLYEAGPTSQNQLGRMTSMDIATIKGVVDRLLKRDLMTTTADESDARRRVLMLTDAGGRLVEKLVKAAHDTTAETLEPLSAPERKTLLSLLAKLK